MLFDSDKSCSLVDDTPDLHNTTDPFNQTIEFDNIIFPSNLTTESIDDMLEKKIMKSNNRNLNSLESLQNHCHQFLEAICLLYWTL